MSRFIVVKKNTIFLYLILFLIISFSISSFYYLYKNKSNVKDTFSPSPTDKELNLDLNGDNEKDTLEIVMEKNTYVVKVKTSSKEYILQPSDNSKILGEYSSSLPLKVTTLDLSRNGVPEIIVRTYKNNSPINYIFTWNKDNFSNVYTSNSNMLGILDSNNSRTPKIFSLSSSEGNSSTKSSLFNGKELKDTTFSKDTVPNLNIIQAFIDFVESPYELSEAPDIFTSSIDSTELALLWSLDKEVYGYSFQNGYFQDSDWDDKGNIKTLNWYLSFEEVKKLDSSTEKKELLINLILEKNEYNDFKISSIKKSS